MAKFKQDRYSIFKTFQRLGNNHSHFIADNLDKILGHKLEYRFAEPNWINDDVHIAKMIMIWNWSYIENKLPWYFNKQRRYLSNKYPELVPQIKNTDNEEIQLYNHLIRNNASEDELINKYKTQKYHELLIFLKKIYDDTIKLSDYRLLMSNNHHHQDTFLEFIPHFARSMYLYATK